MLGRLSLLAGSLLFSLVVLELGFRLWRGPEWLLQWPNFVETVRQGSIDEADHRFVHDEALGFVPRPGARLPDASHDGAGMRTTPSTAAVSLPGPDIVAAGDSFTYGYEVDDAGTWPSVLQSILGRRVVNAGVNGYGIDQIVLRAERVAEQVRPNAIVVAFVFDDLRRAEMSRVWGADKPYFDASGGSLQAHNAPVPRPTRTAVHLTIWQRLFGRFVLTKLVLDAFGLTGEWTVDHVRVHPWGEGEAIACLLMERLAALGRRTDSRVTVVALYDGDIWHWRWIGLAAYHHRVMRRVLACASAAGLGAIDTYDAIARAISADGMNGVYRQWHMNAEGNRLVATIVADELARPHMPSR